MLTTVVWLGLCPELVDNDVGLYRRKGHPCRYFRSQEMAYPTSPPSETKQGTISIVLKRVE
jgi:hypothetical protein